MTPQTTYAIACLILSQLAEALMLYQDLTTTHLTVIIRSGELQLHPAHYLTKLKSKLITLARPPTWCGLSSAEITTARRGIIAALTNGSLTPTSPIVPKGPLYDQPNST